LIFVNSSKATSIVKRKKYTKKSVYVKERKIVLNIFVEYGCIHDYHKCKVKYIKLRIINLILISERVIYFKTFFFLQMSQYSFICCEPEG